MMYIYRKVNYVCMLSKGLIIYGMNMYKIKKCVFIFFSIKLFFKNLLFIFYYKFSVNQFIKWQIFYFRRWEFKCFVIMVYIFECFRDCYMNRYDDG